MAEDKNKLKNEAELNDEQLDEVAGGGGYIPREPLKFYNWSIMAYYKKRGRASLLAPDKNKNFNYYLLLNNTILL